MEKHLSRSKPGTKRIQQLIEKQIGHALKTSGASQKSLGEKSVHGIRTDLKKSRAWLRLLRNSVDDKSYRKENKSLRDAGKTFVPLRDAAAMSETWKKLEDQNHFHRSIKLQTYLNKEEDHIHQRTLVHRNDLQKFQKKLRTSRRRIKNWDISPHGWSKLKRGLKRTFRSSKIALVKARKEKTPQSLHEWRKQVKYLRYQVELLEPLWPDHFKEMAEEMHKLTKYLGNDHDLQALKIKIQKHPSWTSRKKYLNEIASAIENRRGHFQKKAFALGDRIFSESANDFSRRLEGYWRLWRDDIA